jgi:hypothetical protein
MPAQMLSARIQHFLSPINATDSHIFTLSAGML